MLLSDNVFNGGVDITELDTHRFYDFGYKYEMPHFTLSSEELLRFLRISRFVCLGVGYDVLTNSVCIEVLSDGVVIMRVADFDARLEYRTRVIDDGGDLLCGVYVMSIDYLLRVLRVAPRNVSFFYRDGVFCIGVTGDGLMLDLLDVDKSKFGVVDGGVCLLNCDRVRFLSILECLSPLCMAAVLPQERRIVFGGGGACVNYQWAAVYAPIEGIEMCLRFRDVQVLRNIMCSSDIDVFGIYVYDASVCSYIYDIGSWRYMFNALPYEGQSSVLSSIDAAMCGLSFDCDLGLLGRLVDLSTDVFISTGDIGVGFDVGGFYVELLMKNGFKSKTYLPYDGIAGSNDVRCYVVVSGLLLRLVLKSFKGQSSARLYLRGRSIGISSNDFRGVVYSNR